MEALLILGGGTDQLYMIKTAQNMGILTVCVDGNKNAPGLAAADYSSSIDFAKTEKVIKFCQRLINDGVPLKGVSTMGSDIPDIISKISSFFGWAGPSAETADWAKHKYKMKEKFMLEAIPVPKFGLVNTTKDIEDFRKNWNLNKLIIKPTDRAGSRGVRIIKENDDLSKALKYAQKYSFNKEILIEEYIDGHQISTETVLNKGSAITPGFADRVYNDTTGFLPIIMENGGWLPSIVDKSTKRKICQLVESAALKLGIVNGVAKGDIVICPKRGPMIIEMAARLSGGDFSESLVPLSTGIEYVSAVIEIALNRPNLTNSKLAAKTAYSVANRYFFVKPGMLQKISGLDEVKKIPGICKLELNYNVGARLPKIDSHAKRTGVFVVRATDKKSCQHLIDKIYGVVRFKVDNIWLSGDPKEYFDAHC